MMTFLKYSAVATLLIVVMGVLGFFLLPWQSWVEEWLSEKLRGQGVPLLQLQLEAITLTHADFTNVRLDVGEPLTIPTLRVEYTKDNLLEEMLDHLEIRGIDYALTLPAIKEKSTHDAFALPSPAILRQLPVEHITIAESNIRIKGDGFNVQLPFEAEIKRDSETLIEIKGETAKITLAEQGSVTVKDWKISLGSIEDIWQLALETNTIDAMLAPLPSDQKTTPEPIPLIVALPTIEGVNLSELTMPNITLVYSDASAKVMAIMAATLAEDKNSLNLQGKPSAVITLPGGAITIPNWQVAVVWPENILRVESISANKLAINLKNSATSGNGSYPMPSLFSKIPVGKVNLKNSHITSNFRGGSFSSGFNAQGKVSPTSSMKIDAFNAVLAIGKQRYELDGLRADVRAADEHWKLSGNVKEIRNPVETQEKAEWLPLAVTFSGSIKRSTISIDVDGSHEAFHLKTGVSIQGSQTALILPTVNVAGGNISAPRITVSSSPITADLKFSEISLEELLQLILKDNKSVQATGRVSGTVPVSYAPDKFRIGTGALHSTTSGFLSIGEQHLGMLPQTVEQVNNVTELLQHFEYRVLDLKTEEKDGKLSVLAALKGKNPAVYEGTEVHLNINLRGDVLETISSALGMIDLSERYLKGIDNAQ